MTNQAQYPQAKKALLDRAAQLRQQAEQLSTRNKELEAGLADVNADIESKNVEIGNALIEGKSITGLSNAISQAIRQKENLERALALIKTRLEEILSDADHQEWEILLLEKARIVEEAGSLLTIAINKVMDAQESLEPLEAKLKELDPRVSVHGDEAKAARMKNAYFLLKMDEEKGMQYCLREIARTYPELYALAMEARQ